MGLKLPFGDGVSCHKYSCNLFLLLVTLGGLLITPFTGIITSNLNCHTLVNELVYPLNWVTKAEFRVDVFFGKSAYSRLNFSGSLPT